LIPATITTTQDELLNELAEVDDLVAEAIHLSTYLVEGPTRAKDARTIALSLERVRKLRDTLRNQLLPALAGVSRPPRG
jgi:hypothetical protein